MAACAVAPVSQSRVDGPPVIPHDDGAGGPLYAGLEIDSGGDVVIEEVEDGVRLFLLETDNVASDCSIECQQAFQKRCVGLGNVH